MRLAGRKVAVFLPNLSGGGAERISVNLVNELVSRGYLVDLLLMEERGPFISLLNPRVNLVNLKVDRMYRVLPSLISYLRMENPVVMLACMWPLTLITLLAVKLSFLNTRIIFAEHITWSESRVEYGKFLRFLIPMTMKFFYPYANGVVAVSEAAAKDLASYADLPASSITTIYNPVVDAASTRDGEIGLPGIDIWLRAPFRILTVGHLKEQKNHELLLKAFALVLKVKDAHLLILGEGQLRGKLEGCINELGISKSISMPGFVDNPYPYYRRASLFVLSSDWEGLPTVLIEALSEGVPIVSTDCPSGPREILSDGLFGGLVQRGDPVALAEMVLDSLATKHDSAALKGRAEFFSIRRSVDSYEELFFPSLGNSNSPISKTDYKR